MRTKYAINSYDPKRRPRKFIDGEKKGRLLVKKYVGNYSQDVPLALCDCDCGTKDNLVNWYWFYRGTITSCGCTVREATSKRSLKDGMSRHYLRSTWSLMLARTYDPECKRYSDYGGRGIQVCDRWRNSFQNFINDMGPRPSKDHSLDRFPNINGDYCPENCRWATTTEQNRNKRASIYVRYNGDVYFGQDLAVKIGLSRGSIWSAMKRMSANPGDKIKVKGFEMEIVSVDTFNHINDTTVSSSL